MCRIMVVCKNNGRKIVVFSHRKCGIMSGDRQIMCRLIVVLKKVVVCLRKRRSVECAFIPRKGKRKKASVKLTKDCRKMEW
jgi:hypothetical protein